MCVCVCVCVCVCEREREYVCVRERERVRALELLQNTSVWHLQMISTATHTHLLHVVQLASYTTTYSSTIYDENIKM